jgi:hypothetical protein
MTSSLLNSIPYGHSNTRSLTCTREKVIADCTDRARFAADYPVASLPSHPQSSTMQQGMEQALLTYLVCEYSPTLGSQAVLLLNNERAPSVAPTEAMVWGFNWMLRCPGMPTSSSVLHREEGACYFRLSIYFPRNPCCNSAWSHRLHVKRSSDILVVIHPVPLGACYTPVAMRVP